MVDADDTVAVDLQWHMYYLKDNTLNGLHCNHIHQQSSKFVTHMVSDVPYAAIPPRHGMAPRIHLRIAIRVRPGDHTRHDLCMAPYSSFPVHIYTVGCQYFVRYSRPFTVACIGYSSSWAGNMHEILLLHLWLLALKYTMHTSHWLENKIDRAARLNTNKEKTKFNYFDWRKSPKSLKYNSFCSNHGIWPLFSYRIHLTLGMFFTNGSTHSS